MQRLLSWVAVMLGLAGLATACSSVSARSVSTASRRPVIYVTIFATMWPTRVVAPVLPVAQPPVQDQIASPTAVPLPIYASMAIDSLAPTATERPEAVAIATPIPKSEAQNAPQADEGATGSDDTRTILWALHNKARAAQGLPGYAPAPLLQQAAQAQADFLVAKPATDLYTIGPNGHVGANGSKPLDRVMATGYTAAAADENWAFDDTAQAAFDWWLSDQYHRPQVLSSRYTQVGFGVAAHPNGGIVFVAVYGAAQ